VPIDAQSIEAPLSLAAVFLVVTVGKGETALAKVRDVLGGLDDLVKTVGFVILAARCRASSGSAANSGIVLIQAGDRRNEAVYADRGRGSRGAVNARRPAFPYPVRASRYVF
jgi:hypothetical protein